MLYKGVKICNTCMYKKTLSENRVLLALFLFALFFKTH